jgi:hypothetical protein
VVAAATWACLGLLFLRSKAQAHGRRTPFSAPAGDPKAGVRYAFTKAMSPMAKESVRENLPSYLAGMAYHGGLFMALCLLGITVAGGALPALLGAPSQVLLAVGLLGGLALLAKRLLKAELRGLSHPDDYVANLLGTAFVALAMTGPTGFWLLSAILLLLYVPLGKLRHCFFFFSTRSSFGAFFGRRGVFPPGNAHVR